MSQVITFQDWTPPVRDDAVPWTTAQIEEGATDAGPWALIDTIDLSTLPGGLDSDPANPSARSFTTSLASDTAGLWYRIIFLDAAGNDTLPTVAIQNIIALSPPTVRAYATAGELARILKIRQPTSEQSTAMQRVLDAAALEIDSELGRSEPFSDPPKLVIEVNLERAVEHWQQQEAAFGIVGLGGNEVAAYVARDSWDRHAHKLAPLKTSWGFA